MAQMKTIFSSEVGNKIKEKQENYKNTEKYRKKTGRKLYRLRQN
ncbi:MAG: hypothetical protein WCS27_16240 [Victivallaceae bacterium]